MSHGIIGIDLRQLVRLWTHILGSHANYVGLIPSVEGGK